MTRRAGPPVDRASPLRQRMWSPRATIAALSQSSAYLYLPPLRRCAMAARVRPPTTSHAPSSLRIPGKKARRTRRNPRLLRDFETCNAQKSRKCFYGEKRNTLARQSGASLTVRDRFHVTLFPDGSTHLRVESRKADRYTKCSEFSLSLSLSLALCTSFFVYFPSIRTQFFPCSAFYRYVSYTDRSFGSGIEGLCLS